MTEVSFTIKPLKADWFKEVAAPVERVCQLPLAKFICCGTGLAGVALIIFALTAQ